MSMPPTNLIDRVHAELVVDLERLGDRCPAFRRETLMPRVEAVLDNFSEAADPTLRHEVRERVLNRLLGYGPLQPLLDDPTITEIMVNGLHSVYLEREGRLLRQDVQFTSEMEILQIINRMVSAVGRRIDESSPMVDARLADGSRINAIIPPLSTIGPVLTIRRFPSQAYTIQKLLDLKTLSPAMAGFLVACVRAKQNLVISGSTGSGKTSTLNALAAAVGEGERLITIEDTNEMRLSHPHLVQLEGRPPNIEGVGEVTIRTLVKNALRMRPDRIIVGEIRGGESLDMLQAMNTGHQGSLTTVHANSPEEALFRIETMALMADVSLPLHAVREQVRSAIHYVIQQERMPDGSRKIVAISEMGKNQDTSGTTSYLMLPLFFYHKGQRRFRSAGHLPEREELFAHSGVPLDPDWFIS